MARVAKKGRYLYRAYRRLWWLRFFMVVLALLLLGSAYYFPVLLLAAPLPLVAYKRIEKKRRIVKSGLEGERITDKRLRMLPKEYLIYSDIHFNGSQIDHLILGRSALYVVETKHVRGRLQGRGSEESWLLSKREGHQRHLYNPMKQVGTHAKQVRRGIQDERVPVIPILHLTHPECTLKVKQPTTLYVEDRKGSEGLAHLIERLDREKPPLSGRSIDRVKERLGRI